MSDDIDDTAFYRIKAATRQLVKRCGGVGPAAVECGVTDTMVSRWQSNTEKTMIPILSAVALERAISEPIVTEAMAELTDYRPALTPGQRIIPTLLGDLGSASRLTAAVLQALEDGDLTPAEARHVDDIYARRESEIPPIRLQLAEVIAAGAK